MSISKMLSKDLESLELKYERKAENARKFADANPNETSIKICENCYKALEQLRRIRAVFERTF